MVLVSSTVVVCAACDVVYPLHRTVQLARSLDAACVERALRGAQIGTVTRRCEDRSIARYAECFRIQGKDPDDLIHLQIPGAEPVSSEARFSWELMNRRPTAEQ